MWDRRTRCGQLHRAWAFRKGGEGGFPPSFGQISWALKAASLRLAVQIFGGVGLFVLQHRSEDALVPRRPTGSISQPTFCAQLHRGKLCWEAGAVSCAKVPCSCTENSFAKMGCWLPYVACPPRGGRVKLTRGCKSTLVSRLVGPACSVQDLRTEGLCVCRLKWHTAAA